MHGVPTIGSELSKHKREKNPICLEGLKCSTRVPNLQVAPGDFLLLQLIFSQPSSVALEKMAALKGGLWHYTRPRSIPSPHPTLPSLHPLNLLVIPNPPLATLNLTLANKKIIRWILTEVPWPSLAGTARDYMDFCN